MFAVPGWSVPSTSLKTQTVTAEPVKPTSNPASQDTNPSPHLKTAKKRKRKPGKEKVPHVTAQNLDDLWKEYIEEDKIDRTERSTSKTPDRDSLRDSQTIKNKKRSIVAQRDHRDSSGSSKRPKSSSNLESKLNQSETGATSDPPRDGTAPLDSHQSSLGSVKDAPLLTPLQQTMRQKLTSARFRHLNQTLYTTESSHSYKLFSENPEMFQEYHEGFRRQVSIWPENPVDAFIQQIRQRGSRRGVAKGKAAATREDATPQKPIQALPLPRTHGICHIADLGCGDARIAQGLEKVRQSLNLRILSYDLQSSNSFVIKADIAHLPLADESIDVAIFCLALMGTNWIDFIEEAFRILRWKGELWVAEIKSRFAHSRLNKQKVLQHSVGHRRRSENPAAIRNAKDEIDTGDFPDELDGQGKRDTSEVSDFVEVLKRRGFLLHNPDAVDLNNKMFVKMAFVKAATPTKGRFAAQSKSNEDAALGWAKRPKYSPNEKEQGVEIDEMGVLKPCVYKLR